MSDSKKGLHYHDYLQLDKILNAQDLESEIQSGKPVHDEMLFIVIHQAYELWFKQIIYEMESILKMFRNEEVDERHVGIATSRCRRIIEIQELLIQQVRVLETMTSLDFLEFRSFLFPASGFQSFQFRKLEVMMGLQEEKRLTYNNQSYKTELRDHQAESISEMEASPSLFEALQSWLERIPFLQLGDFRFVEHYAKAVNDMLDEQRQFILQSDISEEEKESKLERLAMTKGHYDVIINPEIHQQMQRDGLVRLSYKASLAALLIHLYRDEPILHQPFNLLSCIKDIDQLFTAWRQRHAQMVMRMIGRRMGTGGSSGHEYLNSTAAKHKVFADLHHLSTLLVPRSELPPLPAEFKRNLGFYFDH